MTSLEFDYVGAGDALLKHLGFHAQEDISHRCPMAISALAPSPPDAHEERCRQGIRRGFVEHRRRSSL
jgi:hypothetical protein